MNYQDGTLVLEFIHMPDEDHEIPVVSIMVGSQGVATYRFDPSDDYKDLPESCPVCGMDYEYAFIDFRMTGEYLTTLRTHLRGNKDSR